MIRDFLILVDEKNSFAFLELYKPFFSRVQILLPEADFSVETATIQQFEVLFSKDVFNVISKYPPAETMQCMIYMKYLTACLLSNIGIKVFTFYTRECSINRDAITALNIPRENSLLANLFSTLQAHKKPIALAGSSHIISDRVISSLKKSGISFLLLTPRVPVQNKAVLHMTTPAEKTALRDDRRYFMNMNFDALDGENFYEWHDLCEKIVGQEINFLKKEYADITILFFQTQALF